jgi:hypothetical protein
VRLAQLIGAAASRPRQFAALIALVLKTPSEQVSLSSSHAGQTLRVYFDERFLGVFPQNRLCRGVLRLPADHRDYLRGRRRQALRTNLRRADILGITCGQVEDPQSCLQALGVILKHRTNTPGDRARLMVAWEPHFARAETATLIARDRKGEPLAIAAVVIDRDVCLIQFAVASSHEARWALHDHLVGILIGRGAKYLLAEGGGPFGALGFAAELHHYQHLLGYQLLHLVPVSADAPVRRAQPS